MKDPNSGNQAIINIIVPIIIFLLVLYFVGGFNGLIHSGP